METGINNHLKRIASELFISHDSTERSKINSSLSVLLDSLTEYFEEQIDELEIFGSFTRGTTLPRKYDDNSDIDILVIFSDDGGRVKPESYRNRLKVFANKKYPRSYVAKDHPSIVIELNHIKFDLVPALVFETFLTSATLKIPGKNYDNWIKTNPKKFNEQLTKTNTKYNSIVKPIIRFLKYWNAKHGYPYYSFEIETQIADMNFSNDNFESGFLYAIDKLQYRNLPSQASKKVEVLKNNADWVKKYLHREDIDKTKEVLARILPLF